MSGRQSRGRQRIPMRRINSPDDLYATFSKRRLGLYKKASELSTLCSADVGVVIFSPTNNPFSFWHPSPESVIGRYQNPNQVPDEQAIVVEANTRARIEFLNMRLDEVLDEKELFKEREKQLDETGQNRPKGWWEGIPVEDLSEEQVREWKRWFTDLRTKVTTRIDELEMLSMYRPGPPSQFFGNFYNNVPQQAPLQLYGDGAGHYYGDGNGHYYLYGGTGLHHQPPGLYNNYSQDTSTSASAEFRGPLTHAVIPEARNSWAST